jgi:HD-GYP domain-containing protein (c-di-GMP phosphodiesterase class II)
VLHLTPESSPDVQALLARSRSREQSGLNRLEVRGEVLTGAAFLVAAVVIAVAFDSGRSFDLVDTIAAFIALAVASRVVFEVGSVHTAPVQLAFVPSLFVLPPEAVPLVAAAAFAVASLLAHSQRATAVSQVPVTVATACADATFTLGPVLVLLAAGSPTASEAAIGTLLLALVSQFAGESLAARLREWLGGGAGIREQLLESAWIYAVDAMLAPVGFAFALAAEAWSGAILLTLPLIGALLFLARDRRERLSSLMELSEAYRGTAHLLSNVIGHDDAYTGLHTRQVAGLAAHVASRLGLTASQQRKVEFGAMLHDVGKIAISNSIINKPGKLDPHEWEIMETHTLEGQRMLDQIGGLMSEIGAVVRWSHERWDGGGYPDGIAGEQIPIESRIVFCCDAFNAMTTDRPYRRAMSEEAAIAELESNAGSQFDPRVVDALITCLREEPQIAPDADPDDPLGLAVESRRLDKSTIESS